VSTTYGMYKPSDHIHIFVGCGDIQEYVDHVSDFVCQYICK